MAQAAARLLLVEDEESIGELVSAYLEQCGYAVTWVRSGEDALMQLERIGPRLVILDIGLPGRDGFEVCEEFIRGRSEVPILMLTARDEETDRVAGFELGADDYVTKPFSPRELAARVRPCSAERAAARRRSSSATSSSIRWREVTVDGRLVELTGKEFDCWPTARERGIVVSRDQLLDRVWGAELCRRHAHRRRPRRPAPQARTSDRDPDVARQRLQGRPP